MSSEVLQAFLRQSIDSYEALEILLLMQRERRAWTEDALADRLHIPGHVIAECLAVFFRHRLVDIQSQTPPKSYIYSCADTALDSVVRALDQAYRVDRVEVMKMMSANAIDRMRTNAVRVFANAFVLGRDKDRG